MLGQLEAAEVHKLPAKLARLIILTKLRPILEWGSEVCSYTVKERASIEAVWTRALRFILGAPQFVSIEAIQADVDLVPLSIRAARATAILYHKILTMPAQRIVKRLLDESQSITNTEAPSSVAKFD